VTLKKASFDLIIIKIPALPVENGKDREEIFDFIEEKSLTGPAEYNIL